MEEVLLNGVQHYLTPEINELLRMADLEHQVVVDLVEVLEQVLLQQLVQTDHLLEEILVVMEDWVLLVVEQEEQDRTTLLHQVDLFPQVALD